MFAVYKRRENLWFAVVKSPNTTSLTPVGLSRRKIYFLVKHLLIQSLKSPKKFTQPQISIKNKYRPVPAETLQKDTIQLSHMSLTTSVT
jgi:hypothetical protein